MGESVPGRLARLHRTIVEAAPGIKNVELQAFLYVADNEGVSQRDVCEHLGIPQPTVSRALRALKDQGHSLVDCNEIGRQHSLHLSPKGRQLIASLAVFLTCACVAPASDAILSQWERETTPQNYSHGYNACMDPQAFSCDVS